ncbi:NADH-ubiquinone oxidoreductase-F iron-sulfur binding region domain-containing protein [Candidatus Galacturonibacter soehngenii]|uniref:NADP-reducing hydrogenase subunit HndC n=1 Tax=Candidatus Galacturonatibacter soehngenii TaxID=2307010 RepID=A0A7V7QKZ2_9FIRM|nr:NADH-ubiquinone oxidoreductase-F iron-sulfur binding region domain-containing protein [Candidatus Galacturonibacter soehngenii]KAB1438426.1 NADP-reducing hydrogenase subunit HndC [Candidatus Galacturonibacter soehngenii]
MKEILVCNAVPIYEEAPVSLLLLKEKQEQILSLLQENEKETCYLIVPNSLSDIKVSSKVTLIRAKQDFGFTYGNHSALLKVVEGEKAIPYEANELEKAKQVVSVEELLGEQTKKVFITGNANISGVFEFTKQITPRKILDACKSKEKFKGMYFGHPMGLLIDESKLDEEILLTTDYIEILDETNCVLHFLLKTAERFSRESCGRCVFGHEGITQICMILTDITLKKGKQADLDLLIELCDRMKEQSLCEIGVTIAKVVSRAISYFRNEIEEHITKKSCKAGVCAKYVTFHILPDLCTGCMECADECEEDAILGKKKFIHVIEQEECSQCGVCLDACDEHAIVKAGAVKPRCPKKPIPCKK